MMKIIVAFFLIFLSPTLQAQDLITLSIDTVTAEKESGSAKDKMIKEVVEKTAIKYIKELIGETKFDKNRPLINSKILRQSLRFVPWSNGEPGCRVSSAGVDRSPQRSSWAGGPLSRQLFVDDFLVLPLQVADGGLEGVRLVFEPV